MFGRRKLQKISCHPHFVKCFHRRLPVIKKQKLYMVRCFICYGGKMYVFMSVHQVQRSILELVCLHVGYFRIIHALVSCSSGWLRSGGRAWQRGPCLASGLCPAPLLPPTKSRTANISWQTAHTRL